MGKPVLSVQQLATDGFATKNSTLSGDCDVVFEDKSVVTMPIRLAMLNGMFWQIYQKFNVPVKPENIFWIETFIDETPIDCGTKIYRDFVLNKKIPNMDVLGAFWVVMNKLLKFIHRSCREYQVSLDALALDRMCMQPPMAEVCTRTIDEKLGTHAAEQIHTKITDDLHKILQIPGKIRFNPLAPFVKTKILKRNQLPQMFCAYGPRSDIDDSMFKHVINSNAFSGLEDIQDFATEHTSAKKAQYFNNAVIRKAQYFARRMRLGASKTPYFYPGSCGSTVTIPFVIKPKYKKNFIGKYIKVTPEEFKKYDTEKVHVFNDCSIALTKENIDAFVGREIQMWSPFGCRYTDGVCEHCAGYMSQKATAFVPPGIQAGVYSATRLASVVTQKILSAKHLIKTSSKEFILDQIALKWFSKNSDALLWQVGAIKTLKNSYVRVDVQDLVGTISDLQHSPLPSGEAWSTIDRIQIIGPNGNVIDDVGLTDWSTHPYFSNYAMSYMRDHYKDLRIRAEYLDIPMKDWDFHKPMLKFTVVNDDMVTYVTGVDKHMCSKICDYHSIQKCLEDLSELIYNKAEINIFWIEMMARAFLITKSGSDHSIPVITDPNQFVEFDKMSSMISESALSTKLSFERLEELFERPEPTLYRRGTGYGFNDQLFNFAT